MQNFTFNIPTRIIFGRGRVDDIGEYKEPEYRNVLIVTDKVVSQETGAVEELQAGLKDKNIFIFDKVEENPSFQNVGEGARFAVENNIDIVIGIGGGSPMDAAKGIAISCTNDGDLYDYVAGNPLENKPLPVICIPTTSGTGSEVTQYTVFSNHETNEKVGYSNPDIFPKVAIIDPELTYSMPESVIVNTGFDVLTHAIEAYLSLDSSIMSDSIALDAIEIVRDNLKNAVSKDKDAMDKMAYAAMLGGVAIANAGTILLHIMGYPLTVYHNIPHGLANVILLPEFLNFMRDHSSVKEKVSVIDELFRDKGGIENFIADLDISTRLSDYGIVESELNTFTKKVIAKGDIAITPAEITVKEILELYTRAL